MNTTTILIRLGVVVLALAAWHWTQRLIARKSTPRHGLGDRGGAFDLFKHRRPPASAA